MKSFIQIKSNNNVVDNILQRENELSGPILWRSYLDEIMDQLPSSKCQQCPPNHYALNQNINIFSGSKAKTIKSLVSMIDFMTS